MKKDRNWVEYSVSFKVPGPPNSYSSVEVRASFGRSDVAEGDESEVYAEAKLRALDKIPDAYDTLQKVLAELEERFRGS